MKGHVHELIAGYDLEGVPVLLGCWLFWNRLNLVPMGEVGRNYVEKCEEEGRHPICEELDEKGAEKFDGGRLIGGDDGAPV